MFQRTRAFFNRLFSRNTRTTRGAIRQRQAFQRRKSFLEGLEQRSMLATFHVSLSGSDSNLGGAGDPFRTVQAAINAASNTVDGNDVVNVATGVYNTIGVDKQFSIGSTASPPAGLSNLQLLGGWDAAFTTRNPAATPTDYRFTDPAATFRYDIQVYHPNTTIDGFTLRSSDNTAPREADNVLVGATGVTISNNIMQLGIRNGGSRPVGVVTTSADVSGLQVTNNQFNANFTGTPATGTYAIGVFLNPGAVSTNQLIDGNTFQGNNYAAMIDNSGGSNLTISNNSFTRSFPATGFQAISIRNSTALSNINVTSNTFNGNGTGTGITIGGGSGQNISNLNVTRNIIQNHVSNLPANDGPGILINPGTGQVSANIHYNYFQGNSVGLFRVAPSGSGSMSINATKNWWGAISGPSTAANPGGLGQVINDSTNIAFSPWLIDNTDANPAAAGVQLPTTVTVLPGADTSAADNAFRRLDNAIRSAAAGQTIDIQGLFNWTQPNAAAGYLASVANSDTADIRGIELPDAVNNLTITSSTLTGRIIGGGDAVGGQDYESFVYTDDSWSGNGGANAVGNTNLTIEKLQIEDFENSVFVGWNGTGVFHGTKIRNNQITVAGDDGNINDLQNIAVYLIPGLNQQITGNTLTFQGDGTRAVGSGARSFGFQNSTSGGALYDGLFISGNIFQVGAGSTGETIYGIWENSHNDDNSSDISLSNNQFIGRTGDLLDRALVLSSQSTGLVIDGNSFTDVDNVAFMNDNAGPSPGDTFRFTNNNLVRVGGADGVFLTNVTAGPTSVNYLWNTNNTVDGFTGVRGLNELSTQATGASRPTGAASFLNSVSGTGPISAVYVDDNWGSPGRFTNPIGIGASTQPIAFGFNTQSSIAAGISAVDAGGDVYIRSGSYAEALDTSGKNVNILPGNSPGQVAVNGIAVDNNDTLTLELDGTNALTEFDNFLVTGGVALGNATLALQINQNPAGGIFKIIDNDSNDPVSGTFAGLPNLTTFFVSGIPVTVNYSGGDGNDVELTIATPSQVWVNENWVITSDVSPAGLSTGDIVANTGAGDNGTVTNKTFGYNAFTTVQQGVNAVDVGGTVFVLHNNGGSYNENVTINKVAVLSGETVTLGALNKFILAPGENVTGSSGIVAPTVDVQTGAMVNDGVVLAAVGGMVNVAAGTYTEDVLVNKDGVRLLGAGVASTTIIGPIGGSGATLAIGANNVEVTGFTITRAGNTVALWNDPNSNTVGLAIQGSPTGAIVHDNLITGNRNGLDINNSSGHTIRNNIVTNNRTGFIFRNQTDNMTVVENEITNNFTVGILFLDGSGGSNTPVQTAANSTFSNNNISGNWYGQIVDRQTGGSLPAPGGSLKNFSGNWYGTATPVITNANSAEPGYAALIPVMFGGSATAPGGQPDVAGPASANFDITPYLNAGTDTNVETTMGRGTYGFQGSVSSLTATAQLGQTGVTGRIQEAVNAVTTGGTVIATAGTYAESVTFDKGLTLRGPNFGIAGTGVRGAEAIITGNSVITGLAATAVTIDGMKFQTSATNAEMLTLQSANGHVVTNNVFMSSVAGGSGPGISSRAISANAFGSGSFTVSNNLIAGTPGTFTASDRFGTAAWRYGVYSAGQDAAMVVANNRFENTRTAMGLDDYSNAVASVTGNTIVNAGTGIGINESAPFLGRIGSLSSITNNTFNNVDSDFSLRNLTGNPSFNLTATGNAAASGEVMVVLGGSGNETIVGTSGIDILVGDDSPVAFQPSNDSNTFTGGGSNDYLRGAFQQGIDVALYTASLSLASFTPSSIVAPGFSTENGWVLASGGAEGTDSLVEIEVVDGTEAGRFLLVGNGGFPSIQAAVNAAVNGDTIIINSGTYVENVSIGVNVTLAPRTGVSILPAAGNALTITAGTTRVIGTLTTGAFPTIVQSGSTLGGTGSIAGPVTASAGGFIDPGFSPGIFATGTYNQAGTLNIEIVRPAAAQVAGVDFDQLQVTGTVTLSGPLNLIFTGAGTIADYTSFKIIDNDGTGDAVSGIFTGKPNNSTFTANGQSWTISYTGGDGNDVVLVTVPALTPTVTYAEDTAWNSFTIGTVIPDADFTTAGNQSAVFGYDAFTTIQAAVNAVANGGTVIVNGGTYGEDVTMLAKTNILLQGAGSATTTIVGQLGGANETLLIAQGQTVDGFTITRNLGGGENNIGVAFASGTTGATLRNSVLTGNRTAIYMNGSGNSATITRNVINDNRTGMLFADTAHGTHTITENAFTNNRTFGLLLLPTITSWSAATVISNNNISGNFASQVENNAAVTVNASGNWWGSTNPTLFNSSVNTIIGGDPQFNYPGPAVQPGAPYPYYISGTNGAGIDFTPYLNGGTDTAPATPGFQGDFSSLVVHTVAAQTGSVGRVQEGFDLATNGGTVAVRAGSYTGGADAVTGGKNLTLAPGASPAQITIVGNVALNAGDTLAIEVDGTNPVTQYDNLLVTGTVSLGNATLSITGSYVPAAADTFTLINNDLADSVTGTFNGLPASTLVNVNGVPKKILYTGNDGNDVVLVSAQPTTTYAEDTLWTGFFIGQVIADADFTAAGNQPAIFGYDAFSTIQGAVDAVANGGTVIVNGGTYGEDVTMLAKTNILLQGAGSATTTIVGQLGGANETLLIAQGQTVDGFTITRNLGGGENNIGVAFASGTTGATLRNSVLTGNRTAIYMNGSGNSATITRNVINDNRTGMLFADTAHGTHTITENAFTNNRTFGMLLLPTITSWSAATVISNNNISGNFASQIENNAAVTVNASGNWWGSTNPTLFNSSVNTIIGGDPQFNYPGPAVQPGAPYPYYISGTNGAGIDFTPYLNGGTDTAPATPGFQGDFSSLVVHAVAAQTGSVGRIQEGVNLVTVGGTVAVRAGSYVENVTINKALSLLGAQQGVDADTRFAAFTPGVNGPKASTAVEAVLTTPTNSPTAGNPGANDLIRVLASNVTIDGLVIDGNNPLLGASAVVTGGVNLHARRGITNVDTTNTVNPINNLLVQNNILQNLGERGMSLSGAASLTGNSITDNVIRNYGNLTTGGYGVLLLTNAYANVTNNTFDVAPDMIGLQLQNFSNNGSMTWSGNDVTVGQDAIGILTNLFYAASATVNVQNNVVHAASGVTGASDFTWGMYVLSVQVGSTVNVTNNTIGATGGQFARGVNLWNNPTAAPITVSGGTIGNSVVGVNVDGVDPFFGTSANTSTVVQNVAITGGTVGVRVRNTQIGVPVPGGNLSLSLSGTTITGATTGISIEDGTADAFTSALTVGAGNIVSGGTTGLSVNGAQTSLVGNTLNNVAFSGQTGNYITLSNGALDNLEINGTAATFGGLTGAGATVAQNYAIEDKITHAIDDAAQGFVRVKAANTFVTPNSFINPATTTASIQRAIDAATTGNTVNVQAGSYTGGADAVTGGKNLTISLGASPAQVTISGNVALNSGDTLAIEVEGTNPATQYDNLLVTGTVSLGNATLTISGSYVPAAGDSFTLINNDLADNVTGTFNLLPPGAIVNVNGTNKQIFYTGNDGNDVVLLPAVPPATAYVDDAWVAFVTGQFILDADLGTTGNQSAIFNYDAFATVGAGLTAITTGGTVIVNGGTYAEAVVSSGTKTIEITGPDAAQSVIFNSLATAAGQGVVLEGNSILTFGDASATTTIAGIISGTGSLIKQGAQTVIITGANTYTGTTTINAGALRIQNTTALGTSAGGTTVADGATLQLQGGIAVVGEALSLTGQGVGNVGALRSISGNNSWSGNINVTYPAGNVTRVASDANTLTISGNININGTAGTTQFVVQGDGATTISGVISGAGQLTRSITGTGTLTLSGNNTYGGGTVLSNSNSTVILQGPKSTTGNTTIGTGANTVLRLTDANSLGSTASQLLVNGTATNATIQLWIDGPGSNGTITLPQSFGGSAGITTNFDVNNNGAANTNNLIHFAGTTANWGTGTMNVTGSNSYGLSFARIGASSAAGTATFNPTTARLIIGTIVPTTANNYSFLLTGTNAASQVTGVIADSTGAGLASVEKQGAGTWTLGGANLYEGTTTVTTGTLMVNGSIVDGAAAVDVNVNNSAILAGTGSIAGVVNLNGTSRLAPGNGGAESLATGNLAFASGTFFDVEIGGTTAVTQHDQVNVTGTVALANATLNLQQISGFTVSTGVAQQYIIITNDSTDAVTGTFNGLPEGSPVTYAGGTLYVSYSGNDGNDVVLYSQPTVNGTAGTDTLVLRQFSGTQNEFSLNGAAFVQVTNTLPFLFNGQANTDLMLVDTSNGDPIATGNVAYVGELLRVQKNTGLASDTATYIPTTTAGSGTVTLTGFGDIVFTGTSSVDFVNLTTVNVQTATVADTLTIADGNTATNSGTVPGGYSITAAAALTVGGANAIVGLRNVTNANLTTVTGGGDGIDAVTINASTGAFGVTNLAIATGTGVTDTVTVTGALTVGGNINISSQSIAVNNTLTGGATSIVTLNAGAGAITTSGAGIDVIAQDLSASATTGIDLDTTVLNITATNSGAGNINIDETNGANVLNVATTTGAATVTSATGNLNVTTVSASTSVTLTATAGSITDANAAAINVSASSLIASAATGIDLDTTVGTLTATNATSGNIDIAETDAITLTSVVQSTDNNANDIIITAGGTITVGTVNAGTANGDVTLSATSGSIIDNVNDAVADVIGDVVIMTATSGVGESAGNGSLDTTANSLDVSVTAAGLINLNETNAVTLSDIDTANGSITILAGGTMTATDVASLTDADANDITLTTTSGNIAVGTIVAGAAGDAFLTAAAAITDIDATNPDITADDVVLLSTTGVGTVGDPLETVASNLESVGGTGGVFVANSGSLTIGLIGATVGLSATGGSIVVTTTGAMAVAEDVTATGATTDVVFTAIDAVGAGQNLVLNASTTVSSAAAAVTLNAGDNATINGNITSGGFTTINIDFGDAESVGATATVGDGGTLTIAVGSVITTPNTAAGGTYLNGGNDYDTFTFNPQTTTTFFVDGDLPVGGIVGDVMQMDVTGTVNPNLTVPGGPTVFNGKTYNGPGSGIWTFDPSHRFVYFKSIEDSQVIGPYHLTYDNSVAPVGNLVIMLDGTASPNEKLQFRDTTTAGTILYQTTLTPILSVRVLGGVGNDVVTVDDINGLPSFAGSVPGSTGVGNHPSTSDSDASPAPEFFFDAAGGTNVLNLNLNRPSTQQQFAFGTGTAPGSLEAEVQSTNATTGLNAYVRNVGEINRTGIGAAPGGLTVFGTTIANNISIANNGGGETRVAAVGHTSFDFSGNNYNAFVVNPLAGNDLVDLVSFGTAQTNNWPITLNGEGDDDTIRVRSTSGNTGNVNLNGNLGNDTFQLYDGTTTAGSVDSIVGAVVVDGTDGNIMGNTDTLVIIDNSDVTADNVLISAVSPGSSADYAVEGINGIVGNDVVLRNIDTLNYTGTLGNDTIDARFVNTVPALDLFAVSLSGWTGADQFLLFNSDQLGGSGAGFTPTGIASGVGTINLYGDAPGNPNALDGNDVFGATPPGIVGTGLMNVGLVVSDSVRMIRPSASTALAIDGGQPTGPQPPLGDVVGDKLNLDITALPNTAPVVVSTFSPGTVMATGIIAQTTWTQIEDMNLVDQGKLTNVQMGDLFARTTPGSDLIQFATNPTAGNPYQVRLRINATITNYSASNKTIIYSGGSNDTITQATLTIPAEFYGEDGDDNISGAIGNDWLVGGTGNDRINAGRGNNVVWGDNSPTTPTDPQPQDTAVGGDDSLSGLEGADVFYGGAGNDQVSAGGGNDYANGGLGNDVLDGFDGDDRLYGGAGNDTVTGSTGNDLLMGNDGDDMLYGNSGNDVLIGGTGIDLIDAGDGNDLLVSGSVSNESSSWTSQASAGTFSAATYTNPADNDSALLTLLTQWGSSSNRSSIAPITHDGVNDDLFGSLGDDDFCWEMADVLDNPPGISPPDYNAPAQGSDERFGPT